MPLNTRPAYRPGHAAIRQKCGLGNVLSAQLVVHLNGDNPVDISLQVKQLLFCRRVRKKLRSSVQLFAQVMGVFNDLIEDR